MESAVSDAVKTRPDKVVNLEFRGMDLNNLPSDTVLAWMMVEIVGQLKMLNDTFDDVRVSLASIAEQGKF